MSEKDLIGRAKNGDIAAFEQLIEQYQSKIFNLAYRMTSNREDAADAAQDAFIKIYKNIDKFHERSKFSTWIYRLTYNVCIDRIRQNKNTGYEELNENLPDTNVSPDVALENKEKMENVYKAINNLSDDHRDAIILRDINGCSYEDIAQILGCSIGTVKSRINRGRLKLKEVLSDYLEQKSGSQRHKE